MSLGMTEETQSNVNIWVKMTNHSISLKYTQLFKTNNILWSVNASSCNMYHKHYIKEGEEG